MLNHPQATLSDSLDLDRFFYATRNEPYAVIKIWNEFPEYYKGGDIDIFCYRAAEFAKIILGVGNHYVEQGYILKTTTNNEHNLRIDFFYQDRFEFRFEIYQSLPLYKKIQLKPHFIYTVVENAVSIERVFQRNPYLFYVPAKIDEFILRYVEYIEWYETRPDKIKHLEYICDVEPSPSERIDLFTKLHAYTSFPTKEIKSRNFFQRFYFFRWVSFWIKKISSIPPSNYPRAIARRLKSLLSN
jgi:hypothetical protein